MSAPTIRPLTRDDAAAWRDLRIAMLRDTPEAFHEDLSEVVGRSLDDWAASLGTPPDVVFGLFMDGVLMGTAAFACERRPKLAHKGSMTSVYVVPALRGSGWGRQLVRAVIAHARGHVDVLLTGASPAGAPVYHAEGYRTYGIERDASRVAGKAIDDELMAIHFRG